MRNLVLILTLGMILVGATLLWAETPGQVTYQGKLHDDAGSPLTGNYYIQYRIVDYFWTELGSLDARSVTVTDGLFSDLLDIGSLGLNLDRNDLYLVIRVGTDLGSMVELSPREKLTTVIYAMNVRDNAITSNKIADGSIANADVSNTAGIVESKLALDYRTANLASALGSGGPDALVAYSSHNFLADGTSLVAAISTLDASMGGGSVINSVTAGAGMFNSGTPSYVVLDIGAGTGISVTPDQVSLAANYVSGVVYDSRFVNVGEANSITSAMITNNEIVNADIALSAGILENRLSLDYPTANLASAIGSGGPAPLITYSSHNILSDGTSVIAALSSIDAAITGGGFIVGVTAGNGLVNSGSGASPILDVGQGAGISVTADLVSLGADYLSGLAYDSRFVNEGQVGSISTNMIQAGAVGNAQLAANSVTGANISDGSITNADLAANSVNSSNIADNTITSADILDGTIQLVDLGATVGTISGVVAGLGLVGGGASGSVTIDVGAGSGITATANQIAVNSTDLNGTGLGVSSNRLNVLYGTTASTACQGNDGRLHYQNTDVGTTGDFFTLNYDLAGAPPTNNLEFRANRGSSPTTSIRWNEATDQWEFTNDGFAFTALGGNGMTGLTVLSPLQSTGGPTPTLSIPVANGGIDGYLSSTNFTSFNNKLAGITAGECLRGGGVGPGMQTLDLNFRGMRGLESALDSLNVKVDGTSINFNASGQLMALTGGHTHDHNTLGGLQGGGGAEYYHLTASQYSNLMTTTSGAANYVARFTSATNLATGIIRDDGANVGIGMNPNPGYILTVNGHVQFNGYNINGVNKLDCNKIDPVVQVKGKQYATWVWEGVGLRTDVVGTGRLSDGVWQIDLASQPETSDLWLFYQVVAESTIVPLVAPQDSVSLLCRMEGSVLVVKAITGMRDARFSYRLSGKRVDMVQSPEEINVRHNPADVYIDIDQYNHNGGRK